MRRPISDDVVRQASTPAENRYNYDAISPERADLWGGCEFSAETSDCVRMLNVHTVDRIAAEGLRVVPGDVHRYR